MSYKKVGGLHFFRLGRFCVSFCLTKAAPGRVQRDRIVFGHAPRVRSQIVDGRRIFA